MSPRRFRTTTDGRGSAEIGSSTRLWHVGHPLVVSTALIARDRSRPGARKAPKAARILRSDAWSTAVAAVGSFLLALFLTAGFASGVLLASGPGMSQSLLLKSCGVFLGWSFMIIGACQGRPPRRAGSDAVNGRGVDRDDRVS